MPSSEWAEQSGFLVWFHQRYPQILIFSIPNGEYRPPKTAIKLKVTGVVAGVPDLFVPEWKCFLELKRKEGGVLSHSQKKMIAHLRTIGYTVIVGYGATDASRQILDFRAKV